MSAYDITEFLRTAYRPFAYCVLSKFPLNTAYQKGGVTLNYCRSIFEDMFTLFKILEVTMINAMSVKGMY